MPNTFFVTYYSHLTCFLRRLISVDLQHFFPHLPFSLIFSVHFFLFLRVSFAFLCPSDLLCVTFPPPPPQGKEGPLVKSYPFSLFFLPLTFSSFFRLLSFFFSVRSLSYSLFLSLLSYCPTYIIHSSKLQR